MSSITKKTDSAGERLIAAAVEAARRRGFSSVLYDSTLIRMLRDMDAEEIIAAVQVAAWRFHELEEVEHLAEGAALQIRPLGWCVNDTAKMIWDDA